MNEETETGSRGEVRKRETLEPLRKPRRIVCEVGICCAFGD